MITLLLATFLYSPSRSGGLKPVELTGDMQDDWRKHAATAEVCVADSLPAQHILVSWKHLGVKMLKRISFDPSHTPEFVRRQAGVLAVCEGADGVWLEGEEKYPETWKKALAEAEKDAEALLYCRTLAEKGLAWQEKNNKVWIDARRALWFYKFMDVGTENLDTIRLEFACMAKRLEVQLGEKPRDLALTVAATNIVDRAPYVPLEGKNVVKKRVKLVSKEPVALSEGLKFSSDANGFGFSITSTKPSKGYWPGGKGTLRLYIPDGRGSYMSYEQRIDLSPSAPKRAPTDAHGHWFLEERWGKGEQRLYGASGNWRLVPVAHGTYGVSYPGLWSGLDFKRPEDRSSWTVNLRFSWSALCGFWPAMKPGVSDVWYVSLEGFDDIADVACQLDWGKGSEDNFDRLAAGITVKSLAERCTKQVEKVRELYNQTWWGERLYGLSKVEGPTFHRGDFESDKVFWGRVASPLIDAYVEEKNVKRLTDGKDTGKREVLKDPVRYFSFRDRISAARRDYMLLRISGGMPPQPPPKPVKVDKFKEPDADAGESEISLDD